MVSNGSQSKYHYHQFAVQQPVRNVVIKTVTTLRPKSVFNVNLTKIIASAGPTNAHISPLLIDSQQL